MDGFLSGKQRLSETGTPITAKASSSTLPQDFWDPVETIMGTKGKQVGNVIQFRILGVK
jgi:hypothetical protein